MKFVEISGGNYINAERIDMIYTETYSGKTKTGEGINWYYIKLLDNTGHSHVYKTSTNENDAHAIVWALVKELEGC